MNNCGTSQKNKKQQTRRKYLQITWSTNAMYQNI